MTRRYVVGLFDAWALLPNAPRLAKKPFGTGSLANALAGSSTSDYKTAMGYRQTIQKADPKNAFNLDLLGYDAAGAQDYAASLAAFQGFLRVASPTSAEAQRVHSFLPQLAQLVAQQSTSPATGQ